MTSYAVYTCAECGHVARGEAIRHWDWSCQKCANPLPCFKRADAERYLAAMMKDFNDAMADAMKDSSLHRAMLDAAEGK